MDKAAFIAAAKGLEKTYRPNAAVLEQMGRIDIIATVGGTATGKTSIMKRSGLPFVRSMVTRVRRPGETDGVDYDFTTDYQSVLQQIQAGEFAQFLINMNGEFYGTPISSYPAQGACTMAVIASTIPAFRIMGFRRIVPVCIVPPDMPEWIRRLHGHNPDSIAARLNEAKESLGLALNDPDYLFVVNDDLETAAAKFKAIAAGEVPGSKDLGQARQTAEKLYKSMLEGAKNVHPTTA
jgi:guanylate kinase